MDAACPCGSGLGYAACCGFFHQGAEAPTAEALMRSRYAAFVKRDAAYLIRTCHPQLRARFDMRAIQASFALGWCGLEIVAVQAGGPAEREGMVHFRASWRDATGTVRVHDERSRFIRAGGAWLYRDDRG